MLEELKGCDFLSLKDFSKDRILGLLDYAKDLKASPLWRPLLTDKVLGMIFSKSSTRTRISFEVGMMQLGGRAIFLSDSDSQLGRGESIADTARVLSRYLDGIMIRTFSQDDVEELAFYATIPVINGLTDFDHPCQALADLYTIKENFGDFSGKLAYIGDGNNMANALMFAASKVEMEIAIASPQGYKPDLKVVDELKRLGAKVHLTESPKEALQNATVVYTDVWTSMGQEKETAIRKEAFRGYRVTADLMDVASKDAIFMHCLPAHRGEEVSQEVIDGPKSRVFDQAENRLHVQKAVLAALL